MSVWNWESGDPVAAIKRVVQEMWDNPYVIPPVPIPHPLTQLAMVVTDDERKQWEEVWATARVSGRAQVVLAPDRALICRPDGRVDEVWTSG